MALSQRQMSGLHASTRNPWVQPLPRAPCTACKQTRRQRLVTVAVQPTQQQQQQANQQVPGRGFVEPRPPPGMMPPPPPGQAYGQQQQQQPFYPPPYQQPYPQQVPVTPPQERKLGSYANALIAAAFIAGLGIGVYFDSEVTLSPNNVSSTEIIDRSTPNADICMANGYSASVFDMKLYVTFNP